MRTHSEIIKDSGGASGIIAALGLDQSIHTVRSWGQRDAIPGEYWALFAQKGLATLDELAGAAAAKKGFAASEGAAA